MPIDTTLTIYSPALLPQIQTEAISGDFSLLAKVLSKASNDITDVSIAKLLSCPETHLNAKAALHLHGTNQQSSSWVCFAHPVKMQPNRDHMVVSHPDDFDITSEEGELLTHELNDYFKDDDIYFAYQTPGYWVCFSTTPHDITGYSPKDILGENVMQFLPAAKDDIQWRKIFNETQMLMHHSSTNQQRIAQEKKEINSFWFWGGGVLPLSYQTTYSQIFTNNSQFTGLSKLGGATVRSLPNSLSIETFQEHADVLIILDNIEPVMINTYVADAIQLLEKKVINTLIIVPNHTQEFHLTLKDLGKFWRREKNISYFLAS